MTALLEALAAARAPRARPCCPCCARASSGVQGQEVSLENYEDVRGRGSLAREYTDHLPAGARAQRVDCRRGRSGTATPSAQGEVSIEESLRERFRINVGDTMRFDVMSRVIEARVTSVRHVEWADSRAGGFMFVFRPGLLDQAPHGFISFFRGPQDGPARAQAAGTDRDAVSQRVGHRRPGNADDHPHRHRERHARRDGRGQSGGAERAADSDRRRGDDQVPRIYEAAIFKTLGATRRTIASVLLLEYGVLGALAGTIGSVGAIALTWGISRFALDIPWQPLPLVSASGILDQRGPGRRRRRCRRRGKCCSASPWPRSAPNRRCRCTACVL